MKPEIKLNEGFPSFRIILIEAAEIYFTQYINDEKLTIKNPKDEFDKHFCDLMTMSLDLIHLIKQGKLKYKMIDEEYYTYDFINVSFKKHLKITTAQKNSFTHVSKIRRELYLNGFTINDHKYVRYKRSAGAAKDGSCLFIRSDLFAGMNRWSKTGLDEIKDQKCYKSLTTYEAYKALSLSSIINTISLNPDHILFVKDFEHILKDQDVVQVTYDKKEKSLVAKRTITDVTNNLFDGEGLLDVSVFKQCGLSHKGMMLLRNRFFKCCAFNTNLQAWFKKNNIISTKQLFGYTAAKSVKDIKLVVSESCLKYLKMCDDGFNETNIKRWCNEIKDEHSESLFGIVKTDKRTRFFDGDMVETTYQLLNTLQLKKRKDLNLLAAPYIDYIKKIRNIKDAPEYVKLFLKGELPLEEDYDDDSEYVEKDIDLQDYSSYSFRNKVCYDLIDINKDAIKTKVFKQQIFRNIINSFRLKLYDGRILVDGTYATLFGNPMEYLKYITIKDDKQMFNKDNISSSLKEGEIYCKFFNKNKLSGEEVELVGSRAPHMTMGNILYAKNKRVEDIDRWFNLSDNIVVVDAINNNIQQRLNGADYDSDSMLLTNNKLLVSKAKENYDKFPVPVVGFTHEDKPYQTNLDEDKKHNLYLNLHKVDYSIANNKTGIIVNLSQQLNSHLWDKLNRNSRFNYQELYNEIAILAVLAGAEIDSAKRSFPFKTSVELKKAKQYIVDHGYEKEPVFFFYVASKEEGGRKPEADEIVRHMRGINDNDFLRTTMDYLWDYAESKVKAPHIENVELFSLIRDEINTKGLSKKDYEHINKAFASLVDFTNEITNKNRNGKNKKKKKPKTKVMFFPVKNNSYEFNKKDFNARVRKCYRQIVKGINDKQKARKLIKMIEKDTKTPHSYLYVLLYIIAINEKQLDYSLKDLFKYDGGIRGLVRTNNVHAKFVLFDHYYYEYDYANILISTVFQ